MSESTTVRASAGGGAIVPPDELKRTLDFYVTRPDEARVVGENARRRALAEHTLRHRVEEMLQVVGERAGR